jgi:2-polyprenyl-3-methyl-5-hydroxy-6-metoxy-1,4-benzoquinol methylase
LTKQHHETFDYDSIPPGYYDEVFRRGSGVQSFWHRHKFKAVSMELERAGASSHLDIACGPGTFIGNYKAGSDAIGIDMAGGQISYAQSTYGSRDHSFMEMEIVADTEFARTFDGVTLIEFIEHVTPEVTSMCLDVARRHLNPDGVIVLTTPNYRGLWPVLEWGIAKFANGLQYDQQHITLWNKRKLRKFLKANGFEIVTMEGLQGIACFAAPFNWGFAQFFARADRFIVRRAGFLILAVIRPISNRAS